MCLHIRGQLSETPHHLSENGMSDYSPSIAIVGRIRRSRRRSRHINRRHRRSIGASGSGIPVLRRKHTVVVTRHQVRTAGVDVWINGLE